MRNEFTAIIQRDGPWYVAFCPEVPAANGQGHTREEALRSLGSSIELLFEDLREEALSQLPPEAEKATVAVG